MEGNSVLGMGGNAILGKLNWMLGKEGMAGTSVGNSVISTAPMGAGAAAGAIAMVGAGASNNDRAALQ